eukprot:TRINITY_DN47088_c0_g1_i1.p1 TRINITY_DN47088_c0_g1~~TRINITY_DN47088_c0_g1_i1.p1  ORF type:complete len:504 (-),score=46.79 TRINITY_DN47088_c0_g1_i1:155-1666(-)
MMVRFPRLSQSINDVGCRILVGMLTFPVMVLIMYKLSPMSLNWSLCTWCTIVGWHVWLFVPLLGIFGCINSADAIVMTLELGLGGVVVVYILIDYPRNFLSAECAERVFAARILSCLPAVLMAKQVGRTGVYLESGSARSTAWHVPVDILEMLLFFMCGLLTVADAGELWFLIYCSVPVACSSLYLDRTVVRNRVLLSSNTRLMQTAFTALVRIDSPDTACIVETDSAFEVLVDGQCKGKPFSDVCTAASEDVLKLCSISSGEERVIRRLRTTLISTSRSYSQDVELRVVPATEAEAKQEQSILLGVVMMGERLPYSESCTSTPSLLLEQSSDVIGQIRVSAPTSVDTADDLGKRVIDSKTFRRFNRSQVSKSVSSYCGSDCDTSSIFEFRPTLAVDTSTRVIDKRPYDGNWRSQCNQYLDECARSLLEDLLGCFNNANTGCCHWHKGCERLQKLVTDMQGGRSCMETWPTQEPKQQCSVCNALLFDEYTTACWVCSEPLESE